jgi:hypothetical protein
MFAIGHYNPKTKTWTVKVKKQKSIEMFPS